MTQLVGDYLRADVYGVYLWTPRFLAQVMWPSRFWSVSRQRTSCRRGNVHLGPLYFAWYDRDAWAPAITLRERVRALRLSGGPSV